MTWLFFGEAVWETISLLAISIFLIFHLIHYISRKKYAMFQLLLALLVVTVSIIIAVKLGHIVPDYRMTAAIDFILLTAMAMITFDFIVLFSRACGMHISGRMEVLFFWVIGICYLGTGLLLLGFASAEQLAQVDYLVDLMLQPFWLLVLIRLVFLSRGSNKPEHRL
ncbi:hypothetical protein A3F06_03600 [candidate division TM6 bacterium RIFCSPHIGHO2_12_FULL_36_22]|nr:MAG: hypothetical protein A3F06_03600 [candidate division TM6 bacterium RIFCSPHIGHO2_12_FULL_36_22]